MPIYEYRCPSCGEKFEKLVRGSSGAAEIRCPRCNAGSVERQLSVFGISGGSSAGSYSDSASCNTRVGG